MNSRILKETADLIVHPFTALINSCFSVGMFPNTFKITKVLPFFKKGSATDLDNYRPISIIPIFAKVFEIILKNQLLNFLESIDILNNCQFGFHSKCSLLHKLCLQWCEHVEIRQLDCPRLLTVSHTTYLWKSLTTMEYKGVFSNYFALIYTIGSNVLA